jgi:hypothetical protein
LSVDPVGPLSNPINHFGRYHYANNNPYKYTDPDGRFGISASYMNPHAYTPQARQAQANAIVDSTLRSGGTAADFTPVVGDIKGIAEAVADPTPVKVAAATIGLVPFAGDWAARGLKSIDSLKPIHSAEALGSRPDISELSDAELIESVTNPRNGDYVTVNTHTGGVVDGNTRVTELQRRAADPASSIQGTYEIPVRPYTPDNSDFPDLR